LCPESHFHSGGAFTGRAENDWDVCLWLKPDACSHPLHCPCSRMVVSSAPSCSLTHAGDVFALLRVCAVISSACMQCYKFGQQRGLWRRRVRRMVPCVCVCVCCCGRSSGGWQPASWCDWLACMLLTTLTYTCQAGNSAMLSCSQLLLKRAPVIVCFWNHGVNCIDALACCVGLSMCAGACCVGGSMCAGRLSVVALPRSVIAFGKMILGCMCLQAADNQR
jgi:hypothetical protein